MPVVISNALQCNFNGKRHTVYIKADTLLNNNNNLMNQNTLNEFSDPSKVIIKNNRNIEIFLPTVKINIEAN